MRQHAPFRRSPIRAWDGSVSRGGPEAPGTDRLRLTRDFYAFVERELSTLVDRFMPEQYGKGDGDG